MDTKIIKEYYELTGEFETILYGMKWLNSEGFDLRQETIIKQCEKLWRKFLAFGVNNIGDCEE